jgi:signal transduction histidine kinase
MAASDIQRSPAGTAADRRLARSVLLGLAGVAFITLLGPLLAFFTEVNEVHRLLRSRVAREANVYAEALSLHFRMLEHELERIASRSQVDLLDENLQPERELLDFTHHNSPFFSGVVLLDSQGVPLWSEPKDVLARAPLSSRAWFQRMLRGPGTVVDVLEPGSRTFVVASPVIRQGRMSGAVLGLVDATKRGLPGGRPVTETSTLVVATASGDVLLPAAPPIWTFTSGFGQRLETLVERKRGETSDLSGQPEYVAASRVGDTGLRLLLVAEEPPLLAPVRRRFFGQMLVTLVGQVVTVALFTWFLSRTYLRYRQLDEQLGQQEKMAALGGAASLIAHEVKNSLNGLNAAATLLAQGGEPGLPVKALRGQIERLGHLANSLLQFGKPATAQLTQARLAPMVADAVEALRLLPETEEIQLESELDAGLEVRCDPLLFATALGNLLRNAVEAAVSAKDLGRQPAPRVWVTARRVDGAAQVQVEDNAGGPPPGFEAGLFQPFVTTKPKGIGLGLSMARQALERQGGSLAFERTATGSRFTVQLGLGTRSS